MQVMHDRVLIKPVEPETKTAGGLFLPSAVDPMFEATVIKVGSGKTTEAGVKIPLTVKEGDRVIYNPNTTISVVLNKESFLVIKEEDIFAIMD